MLAKPVERKEPLTINDLRLAEIKYRHTQDHDDLLFLTLLITGFYGLLRLGELTFPDDLSIRDWRKITRRSSLIVRPHQYSFMTPASKADRFFEGNKVVICAFESPDLAFDPFRAFSRYLISRDTLFPASSPLWLTSKGDVPTRSFFMSRFHNLFSKSYGGASMRAGGARISPKSIHRQKSFVAWAGGHQMHGKFIFVFTPPSSKPFFILVKTPTPFSALFSLRTSSISILSF
jgi:hypothetical protein